MDKHGSDIFHHNLGNTDEVLMNFDMPSRRTVSRKGSQDVIIASTGNFESLFIFSKYYVHQAMRKKSFTVFLTCLAIGTMLDPIIIFKRKTIPKEEFPESMIND